MINPNTNRYPNYFKLIEQLQHIKMSLLSPDLDIIQSAMLDVTLSKIGEMFEIPTPNLIVLKGTLALFREDRQHYAAAASVLDNITNEIAARALVHEPDGPWYRIQ